MEKFTNFVRIIEVIMNERLESLDVFRGITIAGMVLVNNPGSWDYVYPALRHASWHGVTPTDLIFPFFLFIVGVAITLSFEKRLSKGDTKKSLSIHIVQRGVTIFLLGEFMSGFPFFNVHSMVSSGQSYWYIGLLLLFSFFYVLCMIVLLYRLFSLAENYFVKKKDLNINIKKIVINFSVLLILIILFPIVFPENGLDSIRIPGVLQRIAVVYMISSFIFLYSNPKSIIYYLIGFLVIYSLFMFLYPVPGYGAGNFTKEGNFSGYLDNILLSGHMWRVSKTWDPEGVFSTLPAISTALFGVLTGKLIKSDKSVFEKISTIFVWGCILCVIGVIIDMYIPINKSIWTTSFSIYCAGMALLFLGCSMYVIDVKGYKKLFKPFLVYGMNAITVFFLSGMLARVMMIYKVNYNGEIVNFQNYLYLSIFMPLFGNMVGSLAYAISYVLFWLFIMWILYRKRIFIKV